MLARLYELKEEVWCRQRIVFSDESRFCLVMHDGRARVRRRRGERRNPQFFVERHVHHIVGVMVWGAIAYSSRSPLIFIRGNMNAQHNARPHVARVTIDFFQHNDVTLLPWPPRSPDLSPIMHDLQRPPQTLEALREKLVVAWNEIPQEDIDHLIRSMPRRVGECVAHQGASTLIKGQRALKQCNHFEIFIIYLLCFIKYLYKILLKFICHLVYYLVLVFLASIVATLWNLISRLEVHMLTSSVSAYYISTAFY
ncbi:unnamed protein product [Acanthoscelides obtectus]|uniref:Transposase n=1 Tax=Acanthoscelides obtectus TaxID=200917 RepID=A0A9P0VTA4_ACAOB|nr:unnamed protein product [Acanthoscelides obtectus]CAK1689424.1 Transposable element Tc3 transposase [Acanthoscelides obtectus]